MEGGLVSGLGFFHALSDIGMFHILTVPGKTDVAFSIYDNQAAGAAGFGAEEGDGYLGCFAGCLSTRYKIGGAFGYEQASEIFTVARSGDGGIVISVEATTYQGRVAYTARVLVGNAPC